MNEDIKREIKEKISEIEEKSADGNYIYRGEPETFKKEPYCGKVSSSLWREIAEELSKQGIDIPIINTKFVQTEMLSAVQNYANETTGEGEFEIMGQLQHYGGKTNLIDFTTDYLRALFFACDGSPSENGRIVLLQRNEDIDKKYNIEKPENPINRVIAQKSVFVQPLDGFIDPQDICGRVITIPKDLKQWILQHLHKYHDISTETIYNDLHGFIKNQNLHQRSYIDFFIGLSHQFRRDDDLAIAGFDRAIELNPGFVDAYNNRGVAYQSQGDLDRAITNLDKAIDLNPNYATAYNNRGDVYRYQGDFERALTDFDKAIDLKADHDLAYNNRGITYGAMGDYARAIENLDKAIELNPNYVGAYLNRGRVYRDYGDLERAIADFDRVIVLDPQNLRARNLREETQRELERLNESS